MREIILLSEHLVNRIAAGEVVERPASVVKELVENSLDAGASEISVWVEKSGTSLIRVNDDGEGIPFGQVGLAVERHSTSKLRDERGLFCITTLGFRGEALPSIASVSRFEIVSRTGREDVGCRLSVEGGKKGEPAVIGCPVGTTVEVRDLFFNIPARRKFLKSPATEMSHICDVINRMALAYGDVHFRLYQEGKLLCDYVAVPRLKDRLEQVLGTDIAQSMATFSSNRGRVGIAGFLSTTPASFSSTRYLMIYVNRRFVRDRILTHAVLEGYATLLMKGRYPAVALYLDVPFEEVDVNVHPAKHEVRFRRQSDVHDAVLEAVRQGLRRDADDPSVKTADRGKDGFPGIRESPLPYPRAPSERRSGLQWDQTADGELGEEGLKRGFFSSLEILGQVGGCYIVCASPRGIALIDQHAAHERVAFEKMRLQLERGGVVKQNLLIPQVLELPVPESMILKERLSEIEHLGFSLERFGPKRFAIHAAPAILPSGDYCQIVRRMIAEFAESDRSPELRHGLEERLMSMACHSVIRANRKLDKEEIRSLLGDLDEIDFATQCPHGRPVLIEFSESQLERMFKRA